MFTRALAASVALTVVGAWNISVDVPVVAPTRSLPLASTLLSFSIEQDNWPDWSGIDERNEFTYSALSTYANLTGQPPKIRVGADSEDHTVWSPTVTVRSQMIAGPLQTYVWHRSTRTYSHPRMPSRLTPRQRILLSVTNTTSSQNGFRPVRALVDCAMSGLQLFVGTHMVWGVNLGFNNVTNAVNMAKAILNAFISPEVIESGVVLERIEVGACHRLVFPNTSLKRLLRVGNEADLYGNNGLRQKGNWTVEDYVPDWESIADPVVESVGIYSRYGALTLQGAAFASQAFTPREIFALGILNSTAGQAISTYVGSDCIK